MRILHIATSGKGGAGIAAIRAAEAQVKIGLNSKVLTRDQNTLGFGEKISAKNKILSKFVTQGQKLFFQKKGNLMTSFSIDIFNVSNDFFYQFDIIHVHAMYNYIGLPRIGELSKRIPICITLHDQRLFTGGCHYSNNCINFRSDCRKCPQTKNSLNWMPNITLNKSLELLKNNNKIYYVTPSEWLKTTAEQSALLKKKAIYKIANTVPEIYQKSTVPKDQSNSITIGFFASDLNNPLKGLRTLIRACEIAGRKIEIKLKLFGAGKLSTEISNFEVSTHEFNNDVMAVQAYQSCDLIVVPSLQDNYPNVILEALSCGVPVIGSRIGGISEILSSYGLPTFLVNDFRELSGLLLDFKNLNRDFDFYYQARKDFSYETSGYAHLELYKKQLDK
jgi:glycosyltransferase involved in cell wall biosynthesis